MKSRLLLCALLASARLAAQEYRSDSLDGVEVRDVFRRHAELKTGFQPGASGLAIDSQSRRSYEQQQLSTLLSMATPVFVRSYGINSLATLAFRGASSAQSAVLWEGVPLMNAATGIADISLLPVGFSDSIAIRYGGSGAMDGSGSVGGALLLQSRMPRFSERIHAAGSLRAGIGSFGQQLYNGSAALSGKRLELRLRVLHQSARNDFVATDQFGQAFRTQHAAMTGRAGMGELAYRLSSRDLIRAHVWLQDYQREIPRALFEQFSDKRQDEHTARYLLQYSHSGRVWQAYTKLAWVDERFQYEMPSARINSDIRTGQLFGEAGMERGFGNRGRVLVFAPVQLTRLESRDTAASQFRYALAGAWRRSFFNGRLRSALNLRAERIDQESFVLPGLSASWVPAGRTSLRFSIQRSYRAPTLNERFYVPGGNPKLKAEQGWSAEAGYTYLYRTATGIELRHELNTYARLIDNWIIWLGGAIWTPHNIAQVFSRGAETNNSLTAKLGDFRIRAGLGLAWTRSTPTESELPNDRSIGRQLPYTPALTGNARLGIGWKLLDLSYLHSYSGRRFTTSDESSWLLPFHTADLIGSVAIGRRGWLQLQLSVRNIYDQQYAIVAFRPMPGRSFLTGLCLDL